MSDETWHPTACILCSQLRDRGPPARRAAASPASAATRRTRRRGLHLREGAAPRPLPERSATASPAPLRRRGGRHVRGDRLGHGDRRDRRALRRGPGHATAATSIFYYGGGGQGNHLGGGYGRGAAGRARARATASNALAQEKTGEFWVDGQLFGSAATPPATTSTPRWRCSSARTRGSRTASRGPAPMLKAIATRPGPLDDRASTPAAPRPPSWPTSTCRSGPAPTPGASPRSARSWSRRTCSTRTSSPSTPPARRGLAAPAAPSTSPRTARRRGVDEELLRTRRPADRGRGQQRVDLRGPRRPAGTAQHADVLPREAALAAHRQLRPARDDEPPHPLRVSLAAERTAGSGRVAATPVGGRPHHHRAGPVQRRSPTRSSPTTPTASGRCSSRAPTRPTPWPTQPRMREALRALDLVVVIDVAMTETARQADYVLPALDRSSRSGRPRSSTRVPAQRLPAPAPAARPLPGTLPEPEIHARLVRALGALDRRRPRTRCARPPPTGRAAFADAFFDGHGRPSRTSATHGAAVVLYETLGPTLPEGDAAAAAVWGAGPDARHEPTPRPCARRPRPDGDALFDAILASPSGVVFTVDELRRRPGTAWTDGRQADQPGGRRAAATSSSAWPPRTPPGATDEFPFVLSAGERRSSTANTIFRDPAWRKTDADGALRMHPDDAARLGVADGSIVRVTTKRGSAEVPVEVTDTMHAGHISLPNGLGLDYPDADGTAPSRRRPQRAHRRRRPRLVRGHAVAQARAGPAGGGGVVSADPLRRLAVPDRPHHRPPRRLVDAAGAARGVRRPPTVRRDPAGARHPGPCWPPASTAWSTRASWPRSRTRTTRLATSTGSPTRAGPSGTSSPRCGAGASDWSFDGEEPPVVLVDRETASEVRPARGRRAAPARRSTSAASASPQPRRPTGDGRARRLASGRACRRPPRGWSR